MESYVIGPQVIGIISGIGDGRTLEPDSPPVIFIPVRVVGTADIAQGTFMSCPGDLLSKAVKAEIICFATVSNHQAIFMIICQGRDIGNGKLRIIPAILASMG